MQKIHFDLNKFLQSQKEIKSEALTLQPDTEDPLRIGMTQRAVRACSLYINDEYEKILKKLRRTIQQGKDPMVMLNEILEDDSLVADS